MKKPAGITKSIKAKFKATHDTTVKVNWQHEQEWFTFKTGVRGWYGICIISATEFKPQVFKVVWDSSGDWTARQYNKVIND